MNYIKMFDKEIISIWASYYINYKDIFLEFSNLQQN